MKSVDANRSAEQTGEAGCIPDSEYDINCPNYPGPSFKMNYLSSSCRERLRNETCDSFDCHRFIGRIRKVPAYVKNKGNIGGRPKSIVRERPCACCATVGIIQGRELCYECYRNHRRLGTLNDFPTSAELRSKSKS